MTMNTKLLEMYTNHYNLSTLLLWKDSRYEGFRAHGVLKYPRLAYSRSENGGYCALLQWLISPHFSSHLFSFLLVCVVSVTAYTTPALHGAISFPPKYVAQKVRASSLCCVGQLSKLRIIRTCDTTDVITPRSSACAYT